MKDREQILLSFQTYIHDYANKNGLLPSGIAGVYMIEAPDGRKYIGSGNNIKTRWNAYLSQSSKAQRKLFESFKQHGISTHRFSIIEHCNTDLIREREAYWGVYYNVLETGLNSRLPKSKYNNATMCREDIEDIRQRVKRRIISSHEREQMRLTAIINFKDGTHYARIANTGRKDSAEVKAIKSAAQRGLKKPQSCVEAHMKPILDMQTGVFYNSLKEAAEVYKMGNSLLSMWLNGKLPNRTSLRYV